MLKIFEILTIVSLIIQTASSYTLSFYENIQCSSVNEGSIQVIGPSAQCYSNYVDDTVQYPQSIFVSMDNSGDETYEIVFYSDNSCINEFSSINLSGCVTTTDTSENKRISSYKVVQSRQPSKRKREIGILAPENIMASTIGVSVEEYLSIPTNPYDGQIVERNGVVHTQRAFKPNAYTLVPITKWLSPEYSIANFFTNELVSLTSKRTFVDTCTEATKCASAAIFGSYVDSTYTVPSWLNNAPIQGTWTFLNQPLTVGVGGAIVVGYTINALTAAPCSSVGSDQQAILDTVSRALSAQTGNLQAVSLTLALPSGQTGTLAITVDSSTQQAANDCGVHEGTA